MNGCRKRSRMLRISGDYSTPPLQVQKGVCCQAPGLRKLLVITTPLFALAFGHNERRYPLSCRLLKNRIGVRSPVLPPVQELHRYVSRYLYAHKRGTSSIILCEGCHVALCAFRFVRSFFFSIFLPAWPGHSARPASAGAQAACAGSPESGLPLAAAGAVLRSDPAGRGAGRGEAGQNHPACGTQTDTR